MAGSEAKKTFLYLNSTSKFGPFDKFHFFTEEKFSNVAGGVGMGGVRALL